jgi:hypothetical protein
MKLMKFTIHGSSFFSAADVWSGSIAHVRTERIKGKRIFLILIIALVKKN